MIRRLSIAAVAVFQAIVLLNMSARAADAVREHCPLANGSYKAYLEQAQLSGAVGEKIILSFTLEPPEPPPGFFLTVNMKALKAPESARSEKPEVLTGFPETYAVFHASGIYRYGVVVSLVAKSSCGGVKADTIFNGEARIDIHP